MWIRTRFRSDKYSGSGERPGPGPQVGPELLSHSRILTASGIQNPDPEQIGASLRLVGVATEKPSEANGVRGLHTPGAAIKAATVQAKENDKKRHHKK